MFLKLARRLDTVYFSLQDDIHQHEVGVLFHNAVQHIFAAAHYGQNVVSEIRQRFFNIKRDNGFIFNN